MPRATEDQVRQLTGEPETVDAAQAIDAASLLVDEDFADTDLSDARKALIELYLAAHFLTMTTREGPLAAESVDNVTERYHDIYAAGLRSTRFGQQAIVLDSSGVLASLAARAENPDKRTAQIQVI